MVHESHVNAIVYDSRNSRLYSGDGAGVIVVWRRGGGGQGGVEDYGILRKVQHADLIGKAITSLALAPRLRRGQLLVQAHGNTLRLLDLGTYRVMRMGRPALGSNVDIPSPFAITIITTTGVSISVYPLDRNGCNAPKPPRA